MMLVLAGCSTAIPQTDVSYPSNDGYVTDEAGVLTDEQEVELEEILKKADPKLQVAVVTINTTQPLSIEDYTIKLANKWGVGYSKEGEGIPVTDNGIVFLTAVQDRKTRIEVGSGAESYITDAEAGTILDDSVIPFFKNGDWYSGIKAGVNAIVNSI